jgi:hypothetical protein
MEMRRAEAELELGKKEVHSEFLQSTRLEID